METICLQFLLMSTLLNQVVKSYEENEALMLTEYIREERYEEARIKAIVAPKHFKNILSFAGYFTVNQNQDSNMFFWFIPSIKLKNNRPLILWLQGGPGISGMYGLFIEIGPFRFVNPLIFKRNKFAWTDWYSVIFVDNPVGTGFSYTKTQEGFAENSEKVALDLYELLRQFFIIFPEYLKDNFYIVGESFACKFAIDLAKVIHLDGKRNKERINLQGIVIASGFCDPKNQLHYSEHLHQTGLVDEKDKYKFEALEHVALTAMKHQHFEIAFEAFDQMLFGTFKPMNLFKNKTGLESCYNYIRNKPIEYDFFLISDYLTQEEIKKALHVGENQFVAFSSQIQWNLRKDTMKSVAETIQFLLDHYKILFWSGQLDVVTPPAAVESFLTKLKHDGHLEFRTENRCLWRLREKVVGYVKEAGNLTYVVVRNAGHFVPADQILISLDLLGTFVTENTFC